jgi:ABC-type hemin transport system substrate-binding protein
MATLTTATVHVVVPAAVPGHAGIDFTASEIDDVADAVERLADGRGLTPSTVQRAARVATIGGQDVARTAAILALLEETGRAHRVGRRWWPGRAADWTGDDLPDIDPVDEARQARQWGAED